jgi:S-adenosylmethionine:tRNA ribosyltransferase-isomerase
VRTQQFDYYLPKKLIAQKPASPRDSSRLLLVERETGRLKHAVFRDLVSYLEPGDCLVINETKVIPARLKGWKATTRGGVEILLLSSVDSQPHSDKNGQRCRWEALVKPGRRLRPGTEIVFDSPLLRATVDSVLADGRRIVSLDYQGDFQKILEEVGEVPLPPYIHNTTVGAQRYQTVYASKDGSVAAPTAGLHFTPSLLEELGKNGVRIAKICLRIGLDSFQPVRTESVEDHQMNQEHFEVTPSCAAIINQTIDEGKRVIAVGTSSTRVLETLAIADGKVRAGEGKTGLFIFPGYRFRVVDGLITNFHMPRSTHLMLVCAFASPGLIMKVYAEAIREKYRFLSFGDATLIK